MDSKNDDVKTEEKTNDETVEKTPEKDEIKVADDSIKKYLDNIPFADFTLTEDTKDVYSYDSVNIDTINKEILVYKVYKDVNPIEFASESEIPIIKGLHEGFDGEHPSECFKTEDIEKRLKFLFNIENMVLPKKVPISPGILWLQEDLYLGIYAKGSSGVVRLHKDVTYTKNDSELVIYEEVLFQEKYENKIYKDTADLQKNQNELSNRDTYSKYKHTFKNVDGTYYWYSTERI